jgi:LPS sulfotransferase NodH
MGRDFLGATLHTSYLICAGPRTGSNLLASTLRHAEVAGQPFEYFGRATLNGAHMLGLLGLEPEEAEAMSLADRLDRILAAGTTGNGVFGATLHWGHFQPMVDAVRERLGDNVSAGADIATVLRGFFPGIHYVWLRRENHVAQAISHYLARQTGLWQTQANADEPSAGGDEEPVYDFAAIKRLVGFAEREEQGWRRIFSEISDPVFAVTYEELAAEREAIVARVLEFLGVPKAIQEIPEAPLRRLADTRSVAWEERFRAEDAATVTPEPSGRTARG